MKKQKMLSTNKGITLIALVITIIVMLILVAVTISMAVNGGLFEYAGNAGKETNNAIREEQQLASGMVTIDNTLYNSIDEYLGTTGGTENTQGEKFTELYIETKEYKDKNNDTAVIPKGFSVGKSDGINTIEDGLVIQDAKGNQFVWIPVVVEGETQEEKEASFEKIRKDGYLSGWQTFISEGVITEPSSYGYANEEKEYKEMRTSVIENEGFYIGRFEAGTEEPRYEGVANETDKLVVKRDMYPYNYVAWGKTMDDYESIIKYDFNNFDLNDETGLDQGHGAVYLSKHLLDGQTTDAVSTLCYGVQWDAMLKFIGKDKEEDSIDWGNYYNNDYTITRTTAKYQVFVYDEEIWDDIAGEWTPVTAEGKRKTDEERILLTTGASEKFKLKNLYDVAGNEWEWTMEDGNGWCRIPRGGGCRQRR